MLNYILRIVGLDNAINVERALLSAGACWINGDEVEFFSTFDPNDEVKCHNILFVNWDDNCGRYVLSFFPGSKSYTREKIEEHYPDYDVILTITKSRVKQVCIWRKDLKVRTGKKMAQSGHAFEAYKASVQPEMFTPGWFYMYTGRRKIVVGVENEEELLQYQQSLKQLSIPHTLITDSGFTEFNGVPTNTCIGIHPNWDEDIDCVTGNLSLY